MDKTSIEPFGVFCILELDREWIKFRKALEQSEKLISNPSLKQVIQTVTSPAELLMLLPSCLADLAIQRRSLSVASSIIDQLLEVSELSLVCPKATTPIIETLKVQLKDHYSKRTQPVKECPSVQALLGSIHQSTSTPTFSAADLSNFLSENPNLLMELLSLVRRDIRLSTLPTAASNRSLNIHHPLYPTKRLQRVPLDKLKGDLLHKVWVAEQNKLISSNLGCGDKSSLEATFVPTVLSAAKQLFTRMSDGAEEQVLPVMKHFENQKGGIALPTYMANLTKYCAIYEATVASAVNSLESLYSMMMSTTQSTPPLRDQVAYGITISVRKNDMRQVCIVVAQGAKVLDMFRADLPHNLRVIDVNFEDRLTRSLDQYWPRVVAVEGVTSDFNVLFTQMLKEKISINSYPEIGRSCPHYITRRVDVSAAKSLTYGKDKQDWDYPDLQAYSLACFAQDPLIECIKLRSRTFELPNFRFDVSVISAITTETCSQTFQTQTLGLRVEISPAVLWKVPSCVLERVFKHSVDLLVWRVPLFREDRLTGQHHRRLRQDADDHDLQGPGGLPAAKATSSCRSPAEDRVYAWFFKRPVTSEQSLFSAPEPQVMD